MSKGPKKAAPKPKMTHHHLAQQREREQSAAAAEATEKSLASKREVGNAAVGCGVCQACKHARPRPPGATNPGRRCRRAASSQHDPLLPPLHAPSNTHMHTLR